jgi:23S rRNA (guanosine2251-2'-O)-methyltransferase
VSGCDNPPERAPLVEHPPGQDLIYGRNPVLEALRGRRKVHTVLLATTTLDAALEAALRAAAHRPSVEHLSPADLAARAGTSDHQDVAALVDAYAYAEPDSLLKTHSLLIALDEVQDPHNLGAVIRTAEAAGAGIVIPRHRAAQVTGAVVKASAGATEHASVAMVRNLADFLQAAKQKGFWVYGAAAEAPAPYTAQDYTYPTCFVVGSEGQGIGRRVASLCDAMVSLPLAGKVTSLNASVSAAILLYEVVRQRAVAGATPGEAASQRGQGSGR